MKQDGSSLAVDEQEDFIVLEFNRNAKRITVSHLRTHEEGPAKSEAPKKQRSAGGGGSGSTRMMDEVNASVEKSTFGDLDVLTALKEQMDGSPEEEAPAEEKKPAAKKKAAAKKPAATKKAATKKAATKKTTAKAEDDAKEAEGGADDAAGEEAAE